jgi:hypothetical protein
MQDVKRIAGELLLWLGGFAGAFVSLRKEDSLSTWKVFFHLISGGLISVYLTPLLSSMISLNYNAVLFTSFIVGYVGYKGVDTIVSYIRKKIKFK